MNIKARDPLAEKRTNRASQDNAQKQFNRGILALINMACEKNKSNIGLDATRTLFKTINATEPLLILYKAGPYFYKYKDFIIKKDEKFFLNADFTSDISENFTIDEPDDNFTENEVREILIAVKFTWHVLSPQEREMVWKHVVGILKSYAQWIKCEKNIRNLDAEIRALRK